MALLATDMDIEKTNILDRAISFFETARQNLLAGAADLWKIKKEELWKGNYDSFSDFLRDVKVSDGTASKLIAVVEHFCVQGGFSHAKIEGTDYEKLYMAIRYPGDTEKQLAAAQTLSRSELRHEILNENDDCEHEAIQICRKCNQRL